MNMKTILKSSVAAAAVMAVVAPAAQAQSNFETGQSKVKLKLYGQVNKAVMWGDDGNNSRTFIVDNQASTTRIGFTAVAPVNADFNFGAQIEAEWRSNGANRVRVSGVNGASADNNETNGNFPGDVTFGERIMEVTMDHKRFGKISLGQGGEATDGIAEYNQSGATLVSGAVAATSWLGNTLLYNSTNTNYTTTTLAGVFAYFDGERDDRVRYDTPKFMGASLSGSFISGGQSSVAARYDDKLGAFKIQGGVGYTSRSGLSTTIEDEIAGSIAVLHDTGLNASFSMGNRNYKKPTTAGTIVGVGTPDDSTFVGGSVGYIAKIFGVGPTAFSVDYYTVDNINRVNTNLTTTEWDVSSYGLGIQQTFSDIGTDIYLGYRNHDIGAPAGTSIDDINVVIAGARVTF